MMKLWDIVLAAAIVTMLAASWLHGTKEPLDKRDPRCDTAARYEAMREGADCS